MTEPRNRLIWRKLCSAKWVDSWEERLHWIGCERLAITQLSGSNGARLEIYDVTEKEAEILKKQFGGEIRNLSRSTADWARSIIQRKPISIRGKLLVTNAEPAPNQPDNLIFIPAGLAFGTGEHATTASCLRLLCDVAGGGRSFWSLLDVGTGTGILAIAAAKLGAKRIEAIDYDATAVKTAKQNCQLNGCSRIVRVRRADILKTDELGSYDVVTANLYGGLLGKAAPRLMRATQPGGCLIFSGILRDQVEEVIPSLRQLNLQIIETRTRGKWCAVLARK
ncbi:MAG: 50S ribosomal protein L11 methyltransferase [Verrucomicrobia bacterium]|nr:50S ribosomal protein L11 methyltransferase [Verrucomicrobiota bacterium]